MNCDSRASKGARLFAIDWEQPLMAQRTVVDTLEKWRLRRGPLIVELPLAFTLTPTHYSVVIPKTR